MSELRFEELIERKRDGLEHSREEIERIVLGFSAGEMPDYQMSAWLMAALLNGLSHAETVWMTDAMVRSGRTLDLSSIQGVKVDKHSTGGVADTTTLVLAPLVASCGVPVAKMSGRGLGHTGGTLDKLESIPGFRVELSAEDFMAQVRDVGIAVVAQSPEIDPADKKIYALRDVTATVPSVPLIVGSIVSKKVAGGADAILLDVKVGSGAFMKRPEDARELATELVQVGRELGREIDVVVTDMDQPLGMAVGNALEVIEAIEILQGKHASSELTELCVALAGRLLRMGGVAASDEEGRMQAKESLSSGAALRKFRQWVQTQGGDGRVADDLTLLPQAAHSFEVRATSAGYISSFNAEGVGKAAMLLGAGRASKDDIIDPSAGLVLAARVGDRIEVGELMCTLFAADPRLFAESERRFRESVSLSDSSVTAPPLFHEL